MGLSVLDDDPAIVVREMLKLLLKQGWTEKDIRKLLDEVVEDSTRSSVVVMLKHYIKSGVTPEALKELVDIAAKEVK